MELIDTHAHLFTKHFAQDLGDVIARAKAVGISRILLPNIDAATIADMKATAQVDAELFLTMMGLHPCDVRENWEEELALIEADLFAGGHVAVGEIGIDMYWDKTTFPRQQQAFARQLGWAKDLNLPVAVHCREAYPQVIEAISAAQDGRLRGVLHCFTGSLPDALTLIDLGFHLGIGGVVTYKNGGLEAVLPFVPINRLLLETDSPYLAPVPHRGKRNESSYMAHVAQRVADILELEVEELARITTANARTLFPNI